MAYTNFFFFDIETTTKKASLFDFKMDDPIGAEIFEKKCNKMKEHDSSWNKSFEELYIEKAPLITEFGKIICMSFGMFTDGQKHVMTIIEEDEEKLMHRISKVFNRASGAKKFLCGYNIKGYDLPWITRKFYKYGIDLPISINFTNIKPWEITVVDIADIWRGTGKFNSSLEEVAYELGIENPKKIMSGDKVHDFYWNKKDTKSIMNYCESDVNCLIKIAEKLKL